jgi:uncharacterized protein (DUF2141 family)
MTSATAQVPHHGQVPDCFEDAGQVADLTVQVTDVRAADGTLVILLFTRSDGFPADVSKAAVSVTVAANHPVHRFTDLPRGSYVVVVFHDKNDNGKLDRSLAGLPKEPIGLSNHPKLRPPGIMPVFERARIEVPRVPTVLINLIEIGR